MKSVWMQVILMLVKTLPIEQLVAAILNYAIKEALATASSAEKYAKWQNRAGKIAEAAMVFSKILEDGQVTDEESVQGRKVLEDAIKAWSKGDPTPETYRGDYRP